MIKALARLQGSHDIKWTYDTAALSVGVLLLMYKSLKILYVRNISELLIYGAAFLLFAIYIICNHRKLNNISMFQFVSIMLLGALCYYDMFRVGQLNVFSLFGTTTKVIGGALVILAPLNDKKAMYSLFLLVTEVIVGIGLAGWILYLLNFPLPHYYEQLDAFYNYEMYYVFNLNIDRWGNFFQRYAGPFLEPGHNATMCVFLLFINGFRLKNAGNIVLLLSVLFSLSLAGYGLLIGAVILTLLYRRMYAVTLVGALAFAGIGIGSAYYLAGENPVYQMVFSRLELNENGDDIVGNNRTSQIFDVTYNRFLKSDKVWLGMGKRAYGTREDGSDNVVNGCAGYQRYFFIRGVAGVVLVLSLLLYYWGRYRTAKTFGFLIVFIVANLIRDYPTKEMWLFLYLMGMPLMYYVLNGTKLPAKAGKKKTPAPALRKVTI